MTVFNSGPQAMTMDFHAGDIGDGRADLGVQDRAVRGDLALGLADAHASRTRGTTPEHRCCGRAAAPEQRPGFSAALTRQTQRRRSAGLRIECRKLAKRAAGRRAGERGRPPRTRVRGGDAG